MASRGIESLGLMGSLKFFLTSVRLRSSWVHPKEFLTRLYVRKGTSDVETFFSIVIRRSYPVVDRPIKSVVDAGANVGYSTAFFSSAYPDATIIAIEPAKQNFEMLKQNLKGLPNVRVSNSALAGKAGQLFLEDATDDSWAFRFSEEPKTTDAVVALTIDDVMSEYALEHIDILKIDIEGGERDVFLNPGPWLERVGSIYVETHDRIVSGSAAAIFAALADFDYKFDVRFEYLIFDHLRRRV
jgi:FkbM family methyltransferase